MACPFCGASSIEYDGTQGNATCTTCGAVLEENTIVAEVTFSESAGGAASVVGTFVAEGKAGVRSGGPGRRQTSQESRERTLENARRKIQNMAVALRLNEHHAEVAQRYFNLAISNNFIQGRRSDHVVACCLYIVCRMEKTPHMLIDFSELLQMNVFKLGVTFLHLSRQLNLRLPLVDPSLYISRFAAMLDFGEDTHRVAHDALRLVSRMDRDWIRTGRRPAGICGACLLIAARMHHYRRSQKEIIQVVKIGEATLRKRLDEFAITPSGQLSVADFREMWLEDAADPPAFAKARKRHFEEDGTASQDGQTHISKRRGSRIIHRGSISGLRPGQDQAGDAGAAAAAAAGGTNEAQQNTLATIAEVSSKGETEENSSEADETERKEAGEQEQEQEEDEAEGEHEGRVKTEDTSSQIPKSELLQDAMEEDQEEIEEEEEEGEVMLEEVEEEFEDEMQEEMDAVMNDPYMKQESDRLDAEDEARKLIPFEPLDDVDDDEIESIILNENEVRVKTQVWLELNKDYLREQEQKRVRIEMEKKMGIYHKKGRKKSKKNQQQQSSSVAEAGKLLLAPKLPKQKSKKINYEALESMDDLFDTKPNYSRHGSPAPMKSIFEEPSLSMSGSGASGPGGVGAPGSGTQGSSRHGSVSREGSARPPGRLSSLSRMIKSSSGGSRPKFSSGGSTATPMGSRSISRETSVLGARSGDGKESGGAALLVDEDDDEEIAPPPASVHRQREMAAAAAAAAAAASQKQQSQQQGAAAGGDEEEIVEEEEEDGGAWSWQKQMGYSQVDEIDYADEYDEYNDYDD
ncbi:transcription factor TFIIIB subunit brf1 [Actinomortierella ambigua]|nr:transcription factor TFIIIB subunit brf1 [Actinomortierella ambigua]